MSGFVPAHKICVRNGVKCMIYGPPGSGKTPVLETAPNVGVLILESGTLSLRKSNMLVWDARGSLKDARDFFSWAKSSNETRKYDTFGFDSWSELAEMVLKEKLGKNRDGRKAYGEMSIEVMDWADQMFNMQQKHVVALCKQIVTEGSGDTVITKPHFPGQDLGVKMPHKFDGIFHLDMYRVQGVAQPVKALLTNSRPGILARDRSGNLAELEPPNLTNLFAKAMM